MTAPLVLDPLLTPEEAEDLVGLWHRFPSYGLIHTDVPEFRGANRKIVPQWLIVVMHHSGLFDEWRMPIATGVAYFGGGRGGELAYYPDGASGEAATYAPRHNTAVVLDTDTVFHGVEHILERLTADLCERGRLDAHDHHLADAELGRLLIGTYVRFPAPTQPLDRLCRSPGYERVD